MYKWDVCNSQISNGAEWKVSVPIKFPKNVQKYKIQNFTLSNEHNEKQRE